MVDLFAVRYAAPGVAVVGSDPLPALSGPCSHAADCGDDGDLCTIAACDAAKGACSHKASPDGAPCDDGDACSQGDACVAGGCAGSAKVCDDGSPSTVDLCAAPSGQCAAAPLAGGGSCGAGKACDGGQCVATVKGWAASVRTGQGFTCAALASGQVACWGAGNSGQLGQGDANNRYDPAIVGGLSAVVQVATGSSHAECDPTQWPGQRRAFSSDWACQAAS